MNAEQFLSVDRPAAITAAHVLKFAIIYVRQSSLAQVERASSVLEVHAIYCPRAISQSTHPLMAAKPPRPRNGEAVSPPPIWYVKSVPGQLVKVPDRRVQEAILRVFALYPQYGSLG